MLPQCSHITKKRGVYYYRRRIPKCPNREVALSLRTRMFRVAECLARPIHEGTVFLVRLTRPQASSDEAHRIAFGVSPPVTTGTLQRA